jgi:hypothetical protein
VLNFIETLLSSKTTLKSALMVVGGDVCNRRDINAQRVAYFYRLQGLTVALMRFNSFAEII